MRANNRLEGSLTQRQSLVVNHSSSPDRSLFWLCAPLPCFHLETLDRIHPDNLGMCDLTFDTGHISDVSHHTKGVISGFARMHDQKRQIIRLVGHGEPVATGHTALCAPNGREGGRYEP